MLALDLGSLYREVRPQLMALARRMVHDEAAAEDVVQQAFLSGIRAAGSFRAEARPTSWLYRITYNAALMDLRSKRRLRQSSLEDLTPDEAQAQLARAAPSYGDDVAGAGERREVADKLGKALATLGEVDRRVVELRLREERSTEEVAAELGLTVSATKARLHRARRHLQDVIEGRAPASASA